MQYTCGCFDGAGTALRSDNVTVPLTDLNIGDVVQAVDAHGNAVWSDVYYLRVGDAGDKHVTAIKLEDGRTLRLTDDHLVYVSPKWTTSTTPRPDTSTERQAQDVRVGEYVWTRSTAGGADKFLLSKVAAVDTEVSSHPLVTVHTLEGPVVVDGVLASSYEYSSTLRWWENLEDRIVYTLLPDLAKSASFAAYQDAWDFWVGNPLHFAVRAAVDAWHVVTGSRGAVAAVAEASSL